MSKISVTTIAGLTSGGDANKVKIDSSNTFHVPGHASVGADIVAGTRALSVAGATDGGSSEILNCFNSSLASKFSVRDDGLVSVAGTLTSSGLITASSGVAIGGTGAANTLDDYEEGTFTPTLTPGGGSYNGLTLTGFYRKIGSVVHVIMRLNITASGDASGSMTVGGLPFTSANLSSGLRIPNVWRENAATGAIGGFHINNNNTTGFLQDTSGSNIAHTTGRQYMINATYFSA